MLVPTLLWIAWWLIAAHPTRNSGSKSLTVSQTLRFVRDLGYSPFAGAALGVSAVAVVLLVAFAGYAVWTVSKGLRAGANVLAWSFAFVFWALGLAGSRGGLTEVTPFRYRYTALVLVLLAVVPRRPIAWPARFPITANRRLLLGSALVVLALGSARGLAVRDDWRSSAAFDGRVGRVTRAEALVVGLGPRVIADATVLPFDLGALRAGELRALLHDYDNPFPASPATADQRLVDIHAVATQADGTRHAVGCKRLRRPFAYQPVGLSVQFLWSPRTAFTVDVRRFGRQWVRVDEGRPGEALRLVLPGLGAGTPWQVRANGACRVGPRG